MECRDIEVLVGNGIFSTARFTCETLAEAIASQKKWKHPSSRMKREADPSRMNSLDIVWALMDAGF